MSHVIAISMEKPFTLTVQRNLSSEHAQSSLPKRDLDILRILAEGL